MMTDEVEQVVESPSNGSQVAVPPPPSEEGAAPEAAPANEDVPDVAATEDAVTEVMDTSPTTESEKVKQVAEQKVQTELESKTGDKVCDGFQQEVSTKTSSDEGGVGSAVDSNSANGCDELQRKIIEQIEYYFGDINLPRDRFLLEEIKKNDGWVSLETMLKFHRLAKLSSEQSVIATALQHSDLMEVSEDKTKIRRNPNLPIPDNSLEYWQTVKQRTVYVKGFAKDKNLDEIMTFVKQFGGVDSIMYRREKSEKRTFKGSIFVTFKTKELAEAFVANDVKEFCGNELLKIMQNDYWAKKQMEMKEKRFEVLLAKKMKKDAEIQEQAKTYEMVRFTKGLVLSVENLPKQNCDLMKIKEFFKKFGDVQYVVYENGDDKAQIRFVGEENGADEAWKKALLEGGGKVLFNENELSAKVLEGEEEQAYWRDFSKSKANRHKRMDDFKRSRGRGRGGRGQFNNAHRGRKRPADNNNTRDDKMEKRAKKTVFEDAD